MEKQMRELLLRSLDGELDPAESMRLEKALQDSAVLRAEKEQLLQVRRLMATLQPAPDPSFAERVMGRLRQERRESSIVRWFPQVAAACLLLLVIVLSAVYFTSGNLQGDTLIGIGDLSPDEAITLLDD